MESKVDQGKLQSQAILDHIEELNHHTLQTSGKDLILVLGSPGSGKSTFTNYMYGCLMRKEAIGDSLEEVITSQNPVTTIEHGQTSASAIPTICPEIEGLNFVDFPGYQEEPQNPTSGIPLAYATSKILVNCASIKGVVVLMNFFSIKVAIDRALADMEAALIRVLGGDLVKYADSIWLGITNVPQKISSEKLRKFISPGGQSTDFSKELMNRLIPRLFIYDPLDVPILGGKTRPELLELLLASQPIPKPSEIVEFALPPELLPLVKANLNDKYEKARQRMSEGLHEEALIILKEASSLHIIPGLGLNTECSQILNEISKQLGEQASKVLDSYSQQEGPPTSENTSQLSGIIHLLVECANINWTDRVQADTLYHLTVQKKEERLFQIKRQSENKAIEAGKASKEIIRLQDLLENQEITAEKVTEDIAEEMDILKKKIEEKNEALRKAEKQGKIAEVQISIERQMNQENLDKLIIEVRGKLSSKEAEVSKAREAEKVDLAEVRRISRQKAYHRQVERGTERLFVRSTDERKVVLQEVLQTIRNDPSYVHIYYEYSHNSYAIVLINQEKQNMYWFSGNDGWRQLAQRHTLGRVSTSENGVACFGKKSEIYQNRNVVYQQPQQSRYCTFL